VPEVPISKLGKEFDYHDIFVGSLSPPRQEPG